MVCHGDFKVTRNLVVVKTDEIENPAVLSDPSLRTSGLCKACNRMLLLQGTHELGERFHYRACPWSIS